MCGSFEEESVDIYSYQQCVAGWWMGVTKCMCVCVVCMCICVFGVRVDVCVCGCVAKPYFFFGVYCRRRSTNSETARTD